MKPEDDASWNEHRMRAQIAILCGGVLGFGLAVLAWTGPRPGPGPVALQHLSEAHIVEIRNARGEGVLSGEFRSRTDAFGGVEKDAALVDSRGHQVIGEVELEFPHPDRTDRRPELEVDVMGLAPNQRFAIVVDNQPVGIFTTDDRGAADLEIQEGEVLQ
jgi:hypothetical protein